MDEAYVDGVGDGWKGLVSGRGSVVVATAGVLEDDLCGGASRVVHHPLGVVALKSER